MIATLHSAMIGNKSRLPWNGIHVPICESATSGFETPIPSAVRWPPPTRPVANNSVKTMQKMATNTVATNGLLCFECVRPKTRGRMLSRPIENR